jgi:hypothetical protein
MEFTACPAADNPVPAVAQRRLLAMAVIWPISTRVNKPENDDPSIIEPKELASDAA